MPNIKVTKSSSKNRKKVVEDKTKAVVNSKKEKEPLIVNKADGKFYAQNIQKTLILFLIFFLPIIFLPLSLSSLVTIKMSLVYVVVFVSLIALLVSSINKRKITLPWNIFGISILLIPIVYLVSGLFSNQLNISIFGRDFAPDSVVAILSLFGLLVITAKVTIGKKQQIIYFYLALLSSSIVVAVFHLLHLLVPVVPSFGFFNFPIASSLGKWNDLGLFSTLIVALSAITIEQIKLVKPAKIFLYVTFILNFVLVLIVNFGLSWFILGIFSVILFVYKFLNSKDLEDKNIKIKFLANRLSKLSVVIFIVSLVFIFAGGFIGNKIYTTLNISHLEARPSLEGTLEVTEKTLRESPVLGSGPATFEAQWPKYKPQSILATDFWNNDFRYGFGLIPSFVTTTGILGGVTWLLFFIMLIYCSIKSCIKKPEDPSVRFVLFSSFVGTFILWAVAILYLPSTVLLVLAFLFTGVYISVLSEIGLFKTREILLSEGSGIAKLLSVTNVLLVIVIIFVGYIMTNKFIAHSYFQQAVSEVSQGENIESIETKVLFASKIDPIDTYFRSIAELETSKLDNLLIIANNGGEVSQEEIQKLVESIVENYNKAIAYDLNNHNNYTGLANFYRGLTRIGVEGVYESAKALYGKSLDLKPNNPLIYLEIGRLEAGRGDLVLARSAINKALEIKPNYSDVVFLLAQLEINEGNSEKALLVLEKSVQDNPRDPQLLFQLGVLNYNLENFSNAVSVLEGAVGINPGFQNAKYFLGLSYYEIGKIEYAKIQFEHLKTLNPENQEIEFILNNLKNGETPFFNVSPPILEPEDKEELPLDDTEEIVSEDENGVDLQTE